jgi:ribosomal peptide maturation radical SAM protein 1
VRLLRAAGVTGIQPGIESLSDQVLRLMRKGVRGLQNVQLLKWCLELGVQPERNFLWGFPGEAPEEYQRMAEMARWLTHLPPPTGAAKVRTDRFSPHYNEAEQFGFINLRPLAAYRHIYPFAPEVVARLAYFFDADLLRPQPMADYARPLSEAVEHWRATHSESSLLALDKGEQLLLCDTRPAASAPLRILTGWRKQVYLACDQISTPRQIAAWCRTQKSSAPSLDEIQTILTEFEEQGTLLRDEDAYLALAIAVTS